MSENEKTSENNEGVEKFTLWAVKLFQTQKDEDKFVAIKNKLSQKELENDYYDIVNENEDSTYETFSGLKYLSREEIEAVGITFEKQGQRYNMYFELEEKEGEDEPKATLVKADNVTTWTDSVQLSMSDVRYSKNAKKPFVVLYYSVKEDTFDKAPNKDVFIQGMNDIGLDSDLVAYKGWINFNAFVWLFDNEVEKMKSYKNRKQQWTLSYEQINDGKKTIKRIFGETFETDLLLEAKVVSVSEDKKSVVLEKVTSWNALKDQNLLSLLHFATETEYLDGVEQGGDNMKLTFNVDIVEPTTVVEEDIVEIYLNDSNVKKMKSVKITLPELEITNPFGEEENTGGEEMEMELDEDDIPFG